MRFKLAFLAILFFGIFGMAQSSQATTYYVDATGGNDANNGTAQSAPWKTIAKVNTSTFQPGDSILFKKGEMWREQLTVPSSGTAGNPITFDAYGSGNDPIVDGQGFTWTVLISPKHDYLSFSHITFANGRAGNMEVEGAYITFSLCTFQNANGNGMGHGIRVEATNHVTMDNCAFIGNNSDGVWIEQSNNVTLSNSTVSGNGIGGSGDRDGVGFFDSSAITIRNNSINHTGGYDAAIYGTADGSSLQSADIYRNTIVQKSGLMGYPRIITLSNGTYNFYSNTIDGYSRSEDPVTGIDVEFSNNHKLNANIYNNTISGVDRSATLWSNNVNAGTTIRYENNISLNPVLTHFMISGWGYADENSKLISDHNIFYPEMSKAFFYPPSGYLSTLTTWQTAVNQDADSLKNNPLFVSSSDFHLQSASPAINAGVDVGLTADFAGNPIVGAPDIGAYEYQGAVTDTAAPAAPTGLSVI